MQIATIRRVLPALCAAAALALGTAACGGGDVDKGALTARIKSDGEFGSKLTDAQAGCVADVVIKYLKAEDIQKYIDKKTNDVPDPPADKKEQAGKDVEACVK